MVRPLHRFPREAVSALCPEGWTGLLATWSMGRCLCPRQGLGTGWSVRCLPTETVLWFYDQHWTVLHNMGFGTLSEILSTQEPTLTTRGIWASNLSWGLGLRSARPTQLILGCHCETNQEKWLSRNNKRHQKVEGRKDLIRDEGWNHSSFTLVMGFDLMYNS